MNFYFFFIVIGFQSSRLFPYDQRLALFPSSSLHAGGAAESYAHLRLYFQPYLPYVRFLVQLLLLLFLTVIENTTRSLRSLARNKHLIDKFNKKTLEYYWSSTDPPQPIRDCNVTIGVTRLEVKCHELAPKERDPDHLLNLDPDLSFVRSPEVKPLANLEVSD